MEWIPFKYICEERRKLQCASISGLYTTQGFISQGIHNTGVNISGYKQQKGSYFREYTTLVIISQGIHNTGVNISGYTHHMGSFVRVHTLHN